MDKNSTAFSDADLQIHIVNILWLEILKFMEIIYHVARVQ